MLWKKIGTLRDVVHQTEKKNFLPLFIFMCATRSFICFCHVYLVQEEILFHFCK